MRKTLLIALMTGSLALGAVSTYAGMPGPVSNQPWSIDANDEIHIISNGNESDVRGNTRVPVGQVETLEQEKFGGEPIQKLRASELVDA